MAARQTGSYLRDSLADIHLGDRIGDAAFRDGYSTIADHAATLAKGHLGEYAEEFSYHDPGTQPTDGDEPAAFRDADAFLDQIGRAVEDILVRVYEDVSPHFHADTADVDRAAAADWAAIRDDVTVTENGDGFRLEYDRS